MVVSAHRTRRASYSFSDSFISLRSGQEANVALRRTHSDQQSGDVFRVRPCHGETDWGGLSVSGFRSKEVVQLLRAYDVRLALQEGVKRGLHRQAREASQVRL